MSEQDAKRARVRSKVEASQERMKRATKPATSGSQTRREISATDAQSPASLVKDHPWLTVAAGLGAGILIGALFPKRLGGKVAQRALTLATLATEASLAFGKQARAAASDAGREGLEKASDFGRHATELAGEGLAKLDEETAPLRRNAVRIASNAGGNARSAGLAVAREAIRLAGRIRK